MVSLHNWGKRAGVFCLVAWLFLASQPTFSAVNGVKIYPQSITLGERVTLTLKGDAALRDFEKLDLTELKKHFAINEIDASSDQIRLRLYPITPGQLTLPEMKAGTIYIPSTQIEVKPNLEVTITWQPPKSKVYVSQNLVWNVDVQLKNEANQARLKLRETDPWQVQVTEQPIIETLDAEQVKTASFVANYHYNNVNDARLTKSFVIQSPAVVVKNTSNRRWLFFDQPHQVNIEPLPQFLPVNVPVGKVQLTTAHPGFFKRTHDLNYWVWHLTGQGVDGFVLQNVAHQLIAQMAHNKHLEWMSESRDLQTSLQQDGLKTRLTVRLPYRILQPGLLDLPALQLGYFDVNTGKFITQNKPSKTLFALPIWLFWVVQWLGLMFGLGVLFAVLWQITQAWLNWQLQLAIKQAGNPQQLIEAMFEWQTSQPQPVNLNGFWPIKEAIKSSDNTRTKTTRPGSLKQFQDGYENRFGRSEPLAGLITSLNECLYAQNTHSSPDWETLHKKAQEWVKTNGLPRWFRINV